MTNPTNVISLRLATSADERALRVLIEASVRVLQKNDYTPEQIDGALGTLLGLDTQLVADGTYFVAEITGQLAGSGGWSKRTTLFGGDQSKTMLVDPLLDPTTAAARIRAFYVDPRWSRKGVGSKILTACENAARTAGFKRIELVATLPGEPLYTARGYKKMEAMQLETPDGESLPAFRMTKSL